MKILYGVVGEGMGHATRSRVILDHLTAAGHDIHVVVSGRAHDYLKARFTGVHKIWGFTIAYEDGGVGKLNTVLQNLKGAISGWPQNIRQYFELGGFKPDVVISDFESFSYLYAKNNFLPVISIDNMQVLSRCTQPDDVIAGHLPEFLLAKGIASAGPLPPATMTLHCGRDGD